MSCDTNNPKYELNFIFIDKENAVSTNTRCVTIVEHNQNTEEMWLHISLAKTAIKDSKATHFIIESNNSIISTDKDEFHIMRYSIDMTDSATRFQFQYGTIKRAAPAKAPSIAANFNSSMVRLKADRRFQKNI